MNNFLNDVFASIDAEDACIIAQQQKWLDEQTIISVFNACQKLCKQKLDLANYVNGMKVIWKEHNLTSVQWEEMLLEHSTFVKDLTKPK
jgi:hypothetical protein